MFALDDEFPLLLQMTMAVHKRKGFLKTEGKFSMAQRYADSPQTNPLDLLLAQQPMSRRTVLRDLTGFLLVGGGLAPLASACGSPATAPAASQTPTIHPFGRLLFTYRGHTDTVEHVAWSPDGTRIASGGDDKTVQ